MQISWKKDGDSWLLIDHVSEPALLVADICRFRGYIATMLFGPPNDAYGKFRDLDMAKMWCEMKYEQVSEKEKENALKIH